MGKANRKCYVCDTKYEYCKSCGRDRTKPEWMAEFHEANCAIIFETCVRFNMELISKEEAKAMLANCDLSNKASFKESIQTTLAEILGEKSKTAQAKTTKSHEVVKTEE